MTFTLLAPCSYREEIRKSRFLAQAAPVDSADAAQAFVRQASDASASHNCWAWKVGPLARCSDDGEPGGSAGRPILAALENQNCDFLAVVVTRWYGGIQLGTGGLARAYGGSAQQCLLAGELIEQVARLQLSARCSFAELALCRQRLAQAQAVLEQECFEADSVTLLFSAPAAQLDALQQQLADLSRGRIRLQRR